VKRIVALVIAGISMLVALLLIVANTKDLRYGLTKNPANPIDGLTIFAVFFVAAFTIERLLEPLSILLIPKQEAVDNLSSAMAEAKDAIISFYQSLAAQASSASVVAASNYTSFPGAPGYAIGSGLGSTQEAFDPRPGAFDSKGQQETLGSLTSEQQQQRDQANKAAEDFKTKAEEGLQAATEALGKAQGDAQAKLDVAAVSLAAYQDRDYYRMVIFWAFATIVAMLGSALLNLYFLRAVGISSASRWLEVLATGLIIGAGTKPLHDLTTAINARKEQK
jgi:hypothetical protein